MSTRALLLFLGLTLGCEAEDSKNGDSDVPAPAGKEEIDCGDNAPEVYDLTITNNGLYEFGEGNQTSEVPSILVEVSASDVDGDLTTYILELWYDLEPDGVISDSATQLFSTPGTNYGDECGVGASVFTRIQGIGSSPPLDTVVEFGALVTDSEGHVSDGGVHFTTVFHTPNSAGEVPE